MRAGTGTTSPTTLISSRLPQKIQRQIPDYRRVNLILWALSSLTVGCSREQMRMHDEPPRRRSDVIEWITGDERKHGMRGDIEHLDLLRIYDFGRVDPVAVGACGANHPDLHAGANLPQRPEKGVPMTGNADGAKTTGKGRTRHVSCAAKKTLP